jgi:hypothetical protein
MATEAIMPRAWKQDNGTRSNVRAEEGSLNEKTSWAQSDEVEARLFRRREWGLETIRSESGESLVRRAQRAALRTRAWGPNAVAGERPLPEGARNAWTKAQPTDSSGARGPAFIAPFQSMDWRPCGPRRAQWVHSLQENTGGLGRWSRTEWRRPERMHGANPMGLRRPGCRSSGGWNASCGPCTPRGSS